MATRELREFIHEKIRSASASAGLRESDDLRQNRIEEDEVQRQASGSSESTDSGVSKTSETSKEKLKTGDISTDDIVDALNVIRSGHSFKDTDIHESLEEYINSLSRVERTALLAFLKGIGSIVSGQIAASAATEPSKFPANVKMQKGSDDAKKRRVVHVKPTVVRSATTSVAKTIKSEENRLPPAPITPKKK